MEIFWGFRSGFFTIFGLVLASSQGYFSLTLDPPTYLISCKLMHWNRTFFSLK